jgi:predicted nucleotidyltransferase
MKKYEVSLEMKKQVRQIAERYGLSLIVLFGSRAELRDNKQSDVDVAYMTDETAGKKLSFEDELALAREFEVLFKAPRADIIRLTNTSPLFMYMILQDGVILFEKESALFPEMYTYALKRFEDNMPLYRQRFEYLRNYYHVH